MEGSEDFIKKHLEDLMKVLKEPKASLKILIFLPHIDKKYFAVWRGIVLNPPTGSQPPVTTIEPQDHGALVKQCVLQLFKLFQLLNEQYEVNNSKSFAHCLIFPIFSRIQNNTINIYQIH